MTYATDVYWTSSTNNGAVRAAPQIVGASRDVITPLANPLEMAIFGSEIFLAMFWNNTVVKGPVSGGTPILLASGEDKPYGIAADASGIYWT